MELRSWTLVVSSVLHRAHFRALAGWLLTNVMTAETMEQISGLEEAADIKSGTHPDFGPKTALNHAPPPNPAHIRIPKVPF